MAIKTTICKKKKKCLSLFSNNTTMQILYIVFYPKNILMQYIHVKSIKMSCVFVCTNVLSLFSVGVMDSATMLMVKMGIHPNV